MKIIVLLTISYVLLNICINSANGLQCYSCLGCPIPFVPSIGSVTKVTCNSNEICIFGNGVANDGKPSSFKSCGTQSQCNGDFSYGGITYKTKCCSSSLCNNANSLSMKNTILINIIVFAVATLIYM